MEKKREEGLVSIIVPVYNAEKVIASTIQSVQQQSYGNWELILVDDCSKDGSAGIILHMADKDQRIKYHKLPKNGGAAVARNYGIEKANGRYLAFLDADDQWCQDKLEKQMELMRQKECAFVYSAISMVDEKGNYINEHVPVPEAVDYQYLLKRTVIATSSVLLDMSKWGGVKMPLRRSGQDYATWLMLLRKGVTAYGINEPLVKYRVSSNSLSSNKFKSIKQVFDIQTKNEGVNIVSAAYNTFCFCLYAFKKHFIKGRVKRMD